jgi:hypothetical protein
MVASLPCFPFESNTLMRCRHPQFGESPDRFAELFRARPAIIAFYLLSKYQVKTVFYARRNSCTSPPRESASLAWFHPGLHRIRHPSLFPTPIPR